MSNQSSEEPSDINKLIKEKNIKTEGEAYEDHVSGVYNKQLKELDVGDRKLVQIEFWTFLIAKAIVVFFALWFLGLSFNILSISLDLYSITKITDWRIPAIIAVSFVSGIVAVIAILLRGLSRNKTSSLVDDAPLPAFAKAIVELARAISSKNS